MKQIKHFVLHYIKNAFRPFVSIGRIGSTVIKNAKKPRKLLRTMLYWLKELKFKGKCKALRIQTKKPKTKSFPLFNSRRLVKYHSSAAYIMMEEAYFPLM